MKQWILALSCAFLTACGATRGTYHTSPIVAPSVKPVTQKVEEAKAAVGRADVSAERQMWQIKNAKEFSKRIDNKATVILENWK